MWGKPSQELYIGASIRMAGIIMSRNSATQSKCIESWYQNQKEQRHKAIRKTMKEYPSHHPQGIILAVLEKQCGSTVYQAR